MNRRQWLKAAGLALVLPGVVGKAAETTGSRCVECGQQGHLIGLPCYRRTSPKGYEIRYLCRKCFDASLSSHRARKAAMFSTTKRCVVCGEPATHQMFRGELWACKKHWRADEGASLSKMKRLLVKQHGAEDAAWRFRLLQEKTRREA